MLLILQVGLLVRQQIQVAHSARAGAAVLANYYGANNNLEDENTSNAGLKLNMSEALKMARQAVLDASGLDPKKTEVSLQQNSNLVEVRVEYLASIEVPLLGILVPKLKLVSSLTAYL